MHTAYARSIATETQHYGWNYTELARIRRELYVAGGFAVTLTDRHRDSLRAWLTATDHRAGLATTSNAGGAEHFLPLAAEVCALPDDGLLGRFQTRTRRIPHARYQPRHLSRVAAAYVHEQARYYRTAARHELAEAVESRSGWLIWDRLNCRYVLTREIPTCYPAARDQAARLTEAHRPRFL